MAKRKPKHLAQRAVLKKIRIDLGLTANVVDGEYRINYRKHDPRYRREGTGSGTCYFTNDTQDALDTAGAMARHNAITVATIEPTEADTHQNNGGNV